MDLRNLYQDIIVDHNQHPRNFHDMPEADSSAEGFNPLCGDKVTIYLKIDDEKILDASFVGCGCAISTASASLMSEYLKGKTIEEVETMFEIFHDALTKNDETALNKLGKLAVLAGVKEFPSRVKCATLAWHTLHAALEKTDVPVSTE